MGSALAATAALFPRSLGRSFQFPNSLRTAASTVDATGSSRVNFKHSQLGTSIVNVVTPPFPSSPTYANLRLSSAMAAVAAPQAVEAPNLERLSQALQEVALEVARLPNIDVAGAVTATQLLASEQRITAAIRDAVQDLTQKMDAQFALMPLRLYNLNGTADTLLRYPATVNTTGLPVTKGALHKIKGQDCVRLQIALRLPPFPQNMAVDERCQVVIEYLGALI